MSYTLGYQTNDISMNGILTVSDGEVVISNGSISNVQNLQLENLEINDLTVDNSLTVPSITCNEAEIGEITNTKITSDEGAFNKIKVDTLEALTFQIDNLELEILNLKKSLINRFVNYSTASTHLQASFIRGNKATFRSLNLIPVGTLQFGLVNNFTYPEWVPVDGRYLSSVEFKDLYEAIGTTYGSTVNIGNGVLYFRLPNAQGCFLRPWVGENIALWNGEEAPNKPPEDKNQNDTIRSHSHGVPIQYNEDFDQFTSASVGGQNALVNITKESGSLDYTAMSNSTGRIETTPKYLGAWLFIKS